MSKLGLIATAITASSLLLSFANATPAAPSTSALPTSQPYSLDLQCTATAKDDNGKVIGQRTFNDITKGVIAKDTAATSTLKPDTVEIQHTEISKDQNGKVIGQRTFSDNTKGDVVGAVIMPTATTIAGSMSSALVATQIQQ